MRLQPRHISTFQPYFFFFIVCNDVVCMCGRSSEVVDMSTSKGNDRMPSENKRYCCCYRRVGLSLFITG